MKPEEAEKRDPRTLALVATGGALGAIARYLLGLQFPQAVGPVLSPSMLINVGGSFVVGLLVELVMARRAEKLSLRLFLTSGFTGGFTTLAALTPESVKLFEQQDYPRAVLYAFISIVLASLAAMAGTQLGRRLMKTEPRAT